MTNKKKYTEEEMTRIVRKDMYDFFANANWERFDESEYSGKIVIESMMDVVFHHIEMCINGARERGYNHGMENDHEFLKDLVKVLVRDYCINKRMSDRQSQLIDGNENIH